MPSPFFRDLMEISSNRDHPSYMAGCAAKFLDRGAAFPKGPQCPYPEDSRDAKYWRYGWSLMDALYAKHDG